MARFEVITGPERRRRWSEDQKRAIVAESFAPGAVVSDVARRADISAGQIYRWRQELRGAAGFAQVLIAPAESPAPNPANAPLSEFSASRARELLGRLLGAIVEAPNGMVFFKCTGPAATIAKAQADFDRMIGSLGKSAATAL